MPFKVAAGLTNWDGDSNYSDDPTYGELKFFLNKWDVINKGYDSFETIELESHYCSEEERNQFFDIESTFEWDYSIYHKKLRCFDDDKLELMGNF